MSIRAKVGIAAVLLSLLPVHGRAIVLEDPASFAVKNIWSGPTDLGIPANLGGLLFSQNGNVLYAVGASETGNSALYAIPVTRDPGTNEVTGLGPSAAVTKVFDGNPSTPGLDAGWEFGPGGTLFYTYWSANYLGERPGGVGGAETQFSMLAVGVPRSVAGLAFSPHIVDPGTGFGQMQVSAWQGANLYNVPLTPVGAGIYEPGTVELFVTLPQQGTGAIQYVPSGPFAGDVMYVNWNFGQVRILEIDAATGLPVDEGTGLPMLGTTNPVDELFASELGVGPWGLEFDRSTNDFFVGTWAGTPSNSIIQIGGAGFPPTTTIDTTSTSTTTITTPTTSVTSTTATSTSTSTTSTTLGGRCDGTGTLDDVNCRLTVLIEEVEAAGLTAKLNKSLVRVLTRAKSRKDEAERRLAEGNLKRAGKLLKKSRKLVGKFGKKVGSRRGRRKIPEALRAAWQPEADDLMGALAAAREQIR